MQWSIFTVVSKTPDFRTIMTAIWLHTTTWGCSLVKVKWHFWQAQFLLLCSCSPRMAQKVWLWQIFFCARGPKVAVINPKDHFPVDYIRWCFLKNCSTSYTDQHSHNSSSGPFCLPQRGCWHQEFSVWGEQWKPHDFVEHVREEKRKWHSSCLFVWGALCTAISSPKGWNIFFLPDSLHFNRFPDRRSHICAMS